MCGRYGLLSRKERLELLLGLSPRASDDLMPDYNMAPGKHSWIVRAGANGSPTFESYRWGLAPHWSKDPRSGPRPINAVAETAHEKPMFRNLIRARRAWWRPTYSTSAR
jgi:putative SOS response-associated peptidase YedK